MKQLAGIVGWFAQVFRDYLFEIDCRCKLIFRGRLMFEIENSQLVDLKLVESETTLRLHK